MRMRLVVWAMAAPMTMGAGMTEKRELKCSSASQAASNPNWSANWT